MVDNPAAKRASHNADTAALWERFAARGGCPAAERELLAAALALRSEGMAEALAVAGILDALELDTESLLVALLWTQPGAPCRGMDHAAVAVRFGEAVASIVDGVTRMEAISGWVPAYVADKRGARERSEGLRKLLLTIVEDVRVVLVTLAERLHRLRTARVLDEAERRHMAHLVMEVYAPLASRLGLWQLKWEFEDLAFREIEPQTYRFIAAKLQERRVDREAYICAVVERLGAELAAAGLHAVVTGRPKHIYSIWRKMRAKALEFERVSDVRAVRVLVDSVADCYAALGIVHGLWQHIPREFDDYITAPKGNNYQSLHTAVIGPSGRTLEVQIRTHEMHAHAELGVAAHWRYKEGTRPGPDRSIEHKIAWLRQVLAWKEELEEPGGAAAAPEPGTQERVYVVTPKGAVVDLDAGATPLDFAYLIHTDIGHRCRGAKVNGVMVPLTYRLRSGDRVEVLTTRHAAPSRDWLNANLGYLATGRARAKVRQWFKLQDYDKNLAGGREAYERELRRLGLPRVDPQTLAPRFNLTGGDDLFAAIGRGDVSGAQLASALSAHLPQPAADEAPRTRPPLAGATGEGVRVQGVGNLLMQIARCCKPVPPDPIVGYLTRGRGVTIHRRDCRNLVRLATEERARLLEVSWAPGPQQLFSVNVKVQAYDRQGLLRDITSVLANEKVNVVAVALRTDRNQQSAITDLTLEVSDLAHLSRVIDRLHQVPNVFDVRRCTG